MAQSTDFQNNIKHIVYVMMENRSFDTLLGWLYDGDANPTHVHNIPPQAKPSFNGLTKEFCHHYAQPLVRKFKRPKLTKQFIKRGVQGNVLPNSTPILDPQETFTPVHAQLFHNTPKDQKAPAMLGFLQNYYDAHPAFDVLDGWREILDTYDFDQAPIINTLANNYGVSDEWFCSIPSQTSINRAYSISGNSVGYETEADAQSQTPKQLVNNHQWGGPINYNPAPFIHDTIWNVLSNHGHNTSQDWKIYYSDAYLAGLFEHKTSYTYLMFPELQKILTHDGPDKVNDLRYQPLQTFYDDAKAGTLPRFSYLEPRYTWEIAAKIGIHGTDYHPPSDIRGGEGFLRDIYNALKSSPNWDETLLIVAFDEHGGTFDHVSPPATAVNPYPNVTGECGFDFKSFGVRVPMLFISPWVREHSVIRSGDPQHPFDHTSWLATLLNWFGLPKDSLGARVKAAPTFEKIIGNTKRCDVDLPPLADTKSTVPVSDAAISAELAKLATDLLSANEPGSSRTQIFKEIVKNFDSEDALYADLKKKMDAWVAANT